MDTHRILHELACNAALLLALGLLANFLPPATREARRLPDKLLAGAAVSLVGMAVMLNPLHLAPGVVFDSRSILLAVSGLFFGTLSTAMAMAATAALRVHMGGAGMATGLLVILTSGTVGIIWRLSRPGPAEEAGIGELFTLGFVVHALMLVAMLTLPQKQALGTLRSIALPVIAIYPAATALLGLVVGGQQSRWNARRLLQRSESRYRSMFEDNAAVMFLASPDTGRIIDANKAAGRFYGWSRSTLRGKRVSDLNILPPDMLVEHMRRARTGEQNIFAFRHRLADGRVRDVDVFTGPVRMDGRTVLYSTVYDATERVRAERHLRRSEELHRRIVETANEGVWEVDKDFRITFVNSVMADMLGYAPADIAGRRITEFIFPEDLEEHMAQVAIRTKGRDGRYERRFRRRDGGERWTIVSATALLDDNGAFIGSFAMCTDITEQKQSEETLLLAKKQAEAASRAKSEFLANMSHEIRTPLNGILGMLQILEGTAMGQDQAHCVQTALKSTRRLNSLLADILDLSRIEAGKLRVRDEPFDLSEVMDSMREIFEIEAAGKGLRFEIDMDAGLTRPIEGDASRLLQILFNLVGNAFKFTDHGSVRIGVRQLPGDKSPDGGPKRMLFSVEDTGIGMSDTALARVFETFAQAESSMTRRYGGAGLGLPIVKKLVALMGGNLAVASEVGRGTAVYLCLPYAQMQTHREADTPQRPRGPGKPLCILLVEDEVVNRLVTERILQKSGHKVICAEDGAHALEALVRNTFDLVLMDVQMPVMDGLEATREIRNNPAFALVADVPIIALTAHAMAEDRERFLAAGMTEHVSKPVESDTLTQTIERVFVRHRAQAQ